MKVSRKAEFGSDVIYLSVLDHASLAVVTGDKSFLLLSLENMQAEQSFTFKNANAHRGTKSIAFSPDGQYLAYSEINQSVVRVINIQTRKLHHSFPTLKNRIETLCFSPDSHYLIAGSITGRVYLWNLFSTGQISRLSSFPEYTPHLLTRPKVNYVSAASFSPSGNLVATTGYGGSIVVTNIHTEVLPKRITPSHVRINALKFLHENTLAAGNIEGAIDIIDLHTSQIKKHYQTGLSSVDMIAVCSTGNYLLAAGHAKDIVLIDIKKQKIRDASYITLTGRITQLSISGDDTLFVGCEDGSISEYELLPVGLLKSYINTRAYAKAYRLIQEYPLLEEHTLSAELEQEWENRLSNALKMIEDTHSSDALLLLDNFAAVPSKKKILMDVKSFIQKFPSFNSAVLNHNYTLAYSMAEHTQLLKRSSSYARMEAHWDSCFHKAQTYAITNQKQKLMQLLEPFGRVSSKLCYIQVLLHQPQLFLEFTHHVNAHDYENLSSITHSYPCLKEIKSYKEMLHTANDLYDKARTHIFRDALDLAELELEQLSHIPSMRLQAEELTHIFTLAKELQSLYDQGDTFSCYLLIDKNEILQELPLARRLEKDWNDKMKSAEKEALIGNIKTIKSLLGTLLRLPTRSQKVGTLLRLGFLTQIKYLIIKNQKSTIQDAIDTYIYIFGYDTELHNLILKISKEKVTKINLDEEQMHHRPRSRWLNVTDGKLPNTILQKVTRNA